MGYPLNLKIVVGNVSSSQPVTDAPMSKLIENAIKYRIIEEVEKIVVTIRRVRR